MGAYNTTLYPIAEQCSRCGVHFRRRIQFKYGDTWLEYMVGAEIRWGGNDIGAPSKDVKTLGHGEPCPVCGFDSDAVFDVLIRNGVIEAVVPGDTRPYIGADGATYIDLDDA